MRWSEPLPCACSDLRCLKHFHVEPHSLSVAVAHLGLVRRKLGMDTIVFSQDTRVSVAVPTAHAIAGELLDSLVPFLGRYPEVQRSFLVQFTYPPGYDPTVGDTPCLTCVVQLDADADNRVFNAISRASQSIVDGRLGQWRFLDFFRLTDSESAVIERTTSPFYVRPSRR
jgi:hypothetical protein